MMQTSSVLTYTYRHMDRQMQATTIPEGQNWPRLKMSIHLFMFPQATGWQLIPWGVFDYRFASSPKCALEICVLQKSYFWWEFQAETLHVCPKPCFRHTCKVSAWNSHQKYDFWHWIFSRDYFRELVKRWWNNPLATHGHLFRYLKVCEWHLKTRTVWDCTILPQALHNRMFSVDECQQKEIRRWNQSHVIHIWVRSRNCGCLVTWFCYQLIAKPGNKTASFVTWPIYMNTEGITDIQSSATITRFLGSKKSIAL